jgi:hypothetical protein
MTACNFAGRLFFSLAGAGSGATVARMTRRRVILLAATAISAGFALWEWKRPYDSGNTGESGYEIEFVLLQKQEPGLTLSADLKKTGERILDFQSKPVLKTALGREIFPSHLQMQGDPGNPMHHVEFRFTMQPGDFSGPLQLNVNGSQLTVRRGQGLPSIDNYQTYTTSNW